MGSPSRHRSAKLQIEDFLSKVDTAMQDIIALNTTQPSILGGTVDASSLTGRISSTLRSKSNGQRILTEIDAITTRLSAAFDKLPFEIKQRMATSSDIADVMPRFLDTHLPTLTKLAPLTSKTINKQLTELTTYLTQYAQLSLNPERLKANFLEKLKHLATVEEQSAQKTPFQYLQNLVTEIQAIQMAYAQLPSGPDNEIKTVQGTEEIKKAFLGLVKQADLSPEQESQLMTAAEPAYVTALGPTAAVRLGKMAEREGKIIQTNHQSFITQTPERHAQHAVERAKRASSSSSIESGRSSPSESIYEDISAVRGQYQQEIIQTVLDTIQETTKDPESIVKNAANKWKKHRGASASQGDDTYMNTENLILNDQDADNEPTYLSILGDESTYERLPGEEEEKFEHVDDDVSLDSLSSSSSSSSLRSSSTSPTPPMINLATHPSMKKPINKNDQSPDLNSNKRDSQPTNQNASSLLATVKRALHIGGSHHHQLKGPDSSQEPHR